MEEVGSLFFGQEFDCGGSRKKSRFCAANDQLFHRLLALFTVPERPLIHIHADKLVGQFRVHLACELHGVIQGFFAVFQSVSNAVADGFRDLAPELWSKHASNRIPTEWKRQSRLFLPPDAKINHAVQSFLRKEKLTLMNEQAGFDKIVLNGVDDLVEGHDTMGP